MDRRLSFRSAPTSIRNIHLSKVLPLVERVASPQFTAPSKKRDQASAGLDPSATPTKAQKINIKVPKKPVTSTTPTQASSTKELENPAKEDTAASHTTQGMQRALEQYPIVVDLDHGKTEPIISTLLYERSPRIRHANRGRPLVSEPIRIRGITEVQWNAWLTAGASITDEYWNGLSFRLQIKFIITDALLGGAQFKALSDRLDKALKTEVIGVSNTLLAIWRTSHENAPPLGHHLRNKLIACLHFVLKKNGHFNFTGLFKEEIRKNPAYEILIKGLNQNEDAQYRRPLEEHPFAEVAWDIGHKHSGDCIADFFLQKD